MEVGIANWCFQYLDKSELVKNSNTFAPAAIAGTVVGIYWLLMLVGRFVGGMMGSKVSSRTMLAVTSAIAIALMSAGICANEEIVSFFGFDSSTLSFSSVQIPMNAVFFILCGLCTSVMWGAIFNLAVTGLGKYTAVASGLFMVMVCGGGIFPTLQGIIAKNSILGSFWLTVALTAYMLIYALFLSRLQKKN